MLYVMGIVQVEKKPPIQFRVAGGYDEESTVGLTVFFCLFLTHTWSLIKVSSRIVEMV